MSDSLRDIILDFREAELPTGVPRRVDVTPVAGQGHRVRWSTPAPASRPSLFQQVRKLLDRGVPRENILYLNFFDDRLRFLQHEGLGVVADAYFSLHPEKKNTETVYCFFDEIQVVPGWEPFVDRLMRTEKCEVYITGSSARMLSREIATQMRGRALSWEIFPFSFREFLDFRGIDAGRSLVDPAAPAGAQGRSRSTGSAAGSRRWRGLDGRAAHQDPPGVLGSHAVSRPGGAARRRASPRGLGPGSPAGGQHRVALFRQPAHQLSAIARTPGAEVRGLRLRGVVRGCLLPVHRAGLRRVAGPRQR